MSAAENFVREAAAAMSVAEQAAAEDQMTQIAMAQTYALLAIEARLAEIATTFTHPLRTTTHDHDGSTSP
jgi:hypothetical protein